MRTKILIILSIILFGFGLAFVSCGKKEVAKQKIKLRFMFWGDPNEKKAVEENLKIFESQHPNIEIERIHLDSMSYNNKLRTMMAGGNPPDVFYVNLEDYPGFVEAGHLLLLDDYIERDKEEFGWDDLFEEPRDAFKYKGHYYGIAKDFTPLVLYYNIDLFDKYKVEYPKADWTWNDFLDAMKKLTKDLDGDGRPDIYGFVIETWAAWWQIFLLQNGGGFFNEKGEWIATKEPWLSKNAEALQWVADLINKYKVAPPITATRQLGTYELFIAQKAAMCAYGRWATLRFKDIKSFRWNVQEMPVKEGGKKATTLFTVAYAISINSKKIGTADYAWELLKFMVSPKAEEYVAISGLAVPIRKSLANSDAFLKSPEVLANQPQVDSTPFLRAVKYAIPVPAHTKWIEIRNILDQKVENVLLGNKTAKEALQELESDVEDILWEE